MSGFRNLFIVIFVICLVLILHKKKGTPPEVKPQMAPIPIERLPSIPPDKREPERRVPNQPLLKRTVPPSVFHKVLTHPEHQKSEDQLKFDEAKDIVKMLKQQKVKDLAPLKGQYKSWNQLPLIQNGQGLAILVCGSGDVRFVKGIDDLHWHIVLYAAYRAREIDSENFGTIAVVEDQQLKSFHTSDEPGFFLVDPHDVRNFIIKAAANIFMQVFSVEKGPENSTFYYYGANIYSSNPKTKVFKRIGIVLLDHCKEEDTPWEFNAPRTDTLDFKF